MSDEKCVICFESIADNAKGLWKKGNNAAPIAQGQCCDICNVAVVITRAMTRPKMRTEPRSR